MKQVSAKSLFVNALTFSRVPLIFAYLALAVIGHYSETYVYSLMAFVMGAAAGFSDFFDGLLARRWGVVSEFGKMADPLMDKVYFIVMFPSLVWLAAVQGESDIHAVTLLVFTVLWILRDQLVVRGGAGGLLGLLCHRGFSDPSQSLFVYCLYAILSPVYPSGGWP